MFYGETEIQELVICPYCQNKYDDPRLIECGTSFCLSCIEFLTKEGKNGFQCPVCDEFHEKPKKGYPKNTNLAKLCEKKANKVYRSPLADAFEAELDELKLNMDKLAKENDLGVDKIKDYCDGLRNEVQLHLEESTESLKKQSLELIQKIDEYENEAALKFDKKVNIEMDTFLSETRRFHEKWTDYLKHFKINEEELSLASNEAKKFKAKLNKESNLLLSKLFHFNLPKFEKSTPPDFGSLIDDGVKQSYTQSLASLRLFHLRNTVNCTNISNYSIKPLSNGNICIAYSKHNDSCLRIGVWDKRVDRKLFQKKEEPFNHYDFQLVEVNKTIVLCLFDNDTKANTSRIMKFDCKLKLQKNIELDFLIMFAYVYENKLYLLSTSSDRKSKLIYVYDQRLKLIDSIQLRNSEGLPFYVPNSVTKMRVAANYFVFLDGREVVLMDRLDGSIKRTFCINSSDFVLDSSNDRIIACDKKRGWLVCFDYEGESFEVSLPLLKNFELLDFALEKFVFIDARFSVVFFNHHK